MAGVQQMPNIPALGKPHSLSPTPTAFPAKQSLMLSCTHSPQFSSLAYLASSGFKSVFYKRCVTLRETLGPGLPVSPSLEIPVSSDNGRIMPGQVELDKAGSSLMGAISSEVHLWVSPFQPPTPIGSFRLGGYSCCKRPGGSS